MDRFTFFKNYYMAVKELKPKDQQDFILKILEFMFENKEPKFSEKQREQKLVWLGIVASLTKSKNKSNRNQNGNQ